MERTEPPTTNDSPEPPGEAPTTPPTTTRPIEDADATIEQLHERANADYANSADIRAALDEHTRRYGTW